MGFFSKTRRLRRGGSLLMLWPRIRLYARSMFDSRTPWWSRLVALMAVIYILSPIDFVPDIIPFAGWIDDMVIAPLLLALALWAIPVEVIQRVEDEEEAAGKPLRRKVESVSRPVR
ncbi:MAG: DUF1232 domain-containing protein [Phycisphaeraceae bacterium]|nr:DUF1232 domain-containing protein [Phycisphaeraceae bacterium]